MYTIGDKIVYPMHGAGVIEQIEEKEILGEQREYYVLKVPCGDMKIMIPVDSSDEIGVRNIISAEEIKTVLSVLADVSSEMPHNWNRRYRENMEKLKTGDAVEVAEVVRNLTRTDREKKLSTGEKKMLTNARQILLSEMVLAGGMDTARADILIDEAV
ncbi:CarD family transcriptional regulator [Anaerovorax odorimutans]|uniref:CarD family transcriptional regulator n=1 Tax=Anaerovorax odorimutans TaxID=109327 RepID=A0ABT1RK76_9FIRM|nr:CarD family transcriptional regulator [Anaerovorax odorimutans]MCQ4635574.1 CarD family transcriptional regulator [Anaerovorax odorimutans]